MVPGCCPSGVGAWGDPLCGICMAVVHIPWLRKASPYAQLLLLQQEVTKVCPCPTFCCEDSFFYCSTKSCCVWSWLCLCCFCWSGLSFWIGTENEKRGMQCIDFSKLIYDLFQHTSINGSASEDHALLSIPFTTLRTCCTLCSEGSDQSSCFCYSSSKVIAWFNPPSTGRVWNMLWGNNVSGSVFINILSASSEFFCLILYHWFKSCLLPCYYRNAHAYLE